jgi:outer membrane protein OmpA-like peptidoglycan-associated protein
MLSKSERASACAGHDRAIAMEVDRMSSPTTNSWRNLIAAAELGSVVAGLTGVAWATTSERWTALDATPLILKDGRIANVSVHVLPFQQNDAGLDPRANQVLSRLIGASATDCFLTAQVIGHVGVSEVEATDTLSAHRLARSRADAVQANLIAGGLPAKSIASVWDWQFLVRAPQATLWVFRLTEGEDCEGTPLEGARPVLASATVGEAAAGEPGSAAGTRARPAREVIPARSRSTTATEAAEPGPSAAEEPAPEQVMARRAYAPDPTPVPATTEARPARAPGPADRAAGSALITFATNSSYFPPEARARLEELVAAMAPGERYQVRLEATVSGSSRVVGAKSAEEAERYNRWLAKRRLERVEEWLARHAADREFSVESSLKDHDASRAVKIELVQQG